MTDEALGASFRDPSGFVFEREGTVFRQINHSYAEDYAQLMHSGLYSELTEKGLLLPHAEVDVPPAAPEVAHCTLAPERLDFVSYPYEWCFSQLKDAALTTLKVQRAALRHDMILKDASAYNIQFQRGRPVFIDTLSFTRHVEGRPWVGYRQFCQHFLAPLALVAYRDARLLRLLQIHLDGIPLDLAAQLLPARAWLNIHLVVHIRTHARFQRRYASDPNPRAKIRRMSKTAVLNLITALESATNKLTWKASGTEWADYYAGDSYGEAANEHKHAIVAGFLDEISPREVWDLGANTGAFSRIAAARGVRTLAFDVDPACVDRNYRAMRREKATHLLPLMLDLSNPSPALGWAGAERSSLVARRSADAVMALALIHHLAIANNVPLPSIAALFAELGQDLIVEFVPKSDPKVALLLATREDVFPEYSQAGFEAAFASTFRIERKIPLAGSERTLYRMRRRASTISPT